MGPQDDTVGNLHYLGLYFFTDSFRKVPIYVGPNQFTVRPARSTRNVSPTPRDQALLFQLSCIECQVKGLTSPELRVRVRHLAGGDTLRNASVQIDRITRYFAGSARGLPFSTTRTTKTLAGSLVLPFLAA